ncbi:sigma-70 family RNA polymerase sigma factor [Solibacillus sp. CAU 1738]|uniref:sigma-70 family RNA polymerase sigma factor n=1 Tax=Solibacillus sp. CAU 1738 TaxID=3140363 RepID=UPI0032605623
MDFTFSTTTTPQVKKIEWLEQLMEDYGDSLTKLAYSYVKDIGRAQEIVQDVFFICYSQYEQVIKIQLVKAWLYRVTINRSKDVLRSSWLKRILLNNVLPNYTKSNHLTEQAVLHSEQQQHLLSYVLKLPIKYREALLLFYYEDLSIIEIADLLDINKNTVKTRLKRGRALLEKQLKDGDFHA